MLGAMATPASWQSENVRASHLRRSTRARRTVSVMTEPSRVRQLRVVVEVEDYDRALSFFRDLLGLPEEEAYQGDRGARVAILDAGRATLELANPAQRRMIDDVEVGRQVAGKFRLAFEVDDTRAVTAELVAGGATEVAPPTETPWRSLNARLDAPGDLHITVFQELGPAEPSGDR